MIIAIDGGVASGKSAVGKRVAERLGLAFIDSGLMYRAITRLAAERGIDPEDEDAVTQLAQSVQLTVEGDRVWADGVDLTDGIYDADFAEALPRISAIPGVRAANLANVRAQLVATAQLRDQVDITGIEKVRRYPGGLPVHIK